MTIEEMLANQETTYLEYVDPRAAVDASGAQYDACVKTVVSVKDAIGMQRHQNSLLRWKPGQSDKDVLLDFIAVHWADAHHEKTCDLCNPNME